MAVVPGTTSPRGFARRRPRLALVAATFALAAVLGACSEDLDGGAACATLCPGTDLESREVTLSAVSQAAVVPAILETGGEVLLPLIDRRDTVQTRVVVRFDTLLTQFLDTLTNPDSLKPIDTISDASLLLTLERDRSTVQDSVFFEVYDIDDGTNDTTTAGIESRLVPGRLIGTRRVSKSNIVDAVNDTIAIPLSNSALLAIVKRTDESQRRVRLAIKATSPRSVALRVISSLNSAGGPVLRYKQANTATLLAVGARSDDPADVVAAAPLADFTTLPVAAPRRADQVFAIGGLPARRTLLRFAIPDSIDDAAAIIQAELRLVQVPDPLRSMTDTVRVDTSSTGLRERRDTVVVVPLIGVGGEVVIADPVRAGQLARRSIGADQFAVPAIRIVSSDSGVKTIDVAALLRRWTLQADADPRYLVLAAESEGVQAATAYFWSTAASDPSLRPTLYIRYIPRVGYGIP